MNFLFGGLVIATEKITIFKIRTGKLMAVKCLAIYNIHLCLGYRMMRCCRLSLLSNVLSSLSPTSLVDVDCVKS